MAAGTTLLFAARHSPLASLDLSHGYAGTHRRRGTYGSDARGRSWSPRRALHGDRAEAGSTIPTQDGALQRPHAGDLPAYGDRRSDPRRRAPRRLPDGRVHRVVAGGAAAAPL